MKRRNAVVAMTVGVALFAAGCGGDSCPTEAASVDGVEACTGAPSVVSISLQLCEACSHTAPSCEADLSAAATRGEIFLDTRWDICPDDSSCSAKACAPVICTFSVQPGQYSVYTLTPSGTTAFDLDVSSSSASCPSVAFAASGT